MKKFQYVITALTLMFLMLITTACGSEAYEDSELKYAGTHISATGQGQGEAYEDSKLGYEPRNYDDKEHLPDYNGSYDDKGQHEEEVEEIGQSTMSYDEKIRESLRRPLDCCGVLWDWECECYHDVETIIMHADYPFYRNARDLAKDATDIVRVEVLDGRAEWLDTGLPPHEQYFLFTVHRLRVIETFQGETQPGDIIEVIQHGARLDDVHHIERGVVHLTTGDDLVLFTRFHHDSPHWGGRPGFLLNPTQTVYYTPLSLSGTAMTIAESHNNPNFLLDERLISHNPQNRMGVTVGDIIQIAEENFPTEFTHYRLSFSTGTTTTNPTAPGSIISIRIPIGTNIINYLANNHNQFTTPDLSDITRWGDYKFAGWYMDENFTTPLGQRTTMPNHHVVLYARWQQEVQTTTSTITFQAGQGGIFYEGRLATTTVTMDIPTGDNISYIPIPNNEVITYWLHGWDVFTASGDNWYIRVCSVPWHEVEQQIMSIQVTEDMTFVAIWTSEYDMR